MCAEVTGQITRVVKAPREKERQSTTRFNSLIIRLGALLLSRKRSRARARAMNSGVIARAHVYRMGRRGCDKCTLPSRFLLLVESMVDNNE